MTKAVMTIHGFLTNTDDFGLLYDALTNYDCVFKCKIPGHNDGNFASFTFDATVQRVLADFDCLQAHYDQVDVIGFSMGGGLALMLACQRQIGKLILLAPANKYINVSFPFRKNNFFFRTYNDAFNKKKGKRTQKRQYAKLVIAPYVENDKISMAIAKKHILPNINFHTFGTFAKLMKNANDMLVAKQTLANKTLLVWGKLDELVPYSSVKFVSRFFTDLQTVLFDDVGHALMRTSRAEDIIKLTKEFLYDR